MTKRRKYLYVKLGENRFLRLRVFLRGTEEPNVTPSMELGKDLLVIKKIVKKPSPGYKVISLDELPGPLKDAILKIYM
ncbi:MAG: DUF5622 domain-containing protein [Fervidicoccaceae archaeon]|nr:DUF5622 domain-containing protein [Fervidicoccaceae archaeon]